jgi:hypothetical protein
VYFFKTPAAVAIREADPVQARCVMEIPNLSDQETAGRDAENI